MNLFLDYIERGKEDRREGGRGKAKLQMCLDLWMTSHLNPSKQEIRTVLLRPLSDLGQFKHNLSLSSNPQPFLQLPSLSTVNTSSLPTPHKHVCFVHVFCFTSPLTLPSNRKGRSFPGLPSQGVALRGKWEGRAGRGRTAAPLVKMFFFTTNLHGVHLGDRIRWERALPFCWLIILYPIIACQHSLAIAYLIVMHHRIYTL